MRLKFNKEGLIPAIVQDYNTGQVLMLAYMNKEAFARTLKTKKCVFFSRSRRKLWIKGETSGHIQIVKEILVDCDEDAILIKVKQKGGACHTGFYSCFYRRYSPKKKSLKVIDKRIFEPQKVYKK
jgi:phosphoribosyl-AMP cyclohydrolase